MVRPSDRAIAQAFWHTLETQGALIAGTLNLVVERARELDATAAPVDDFCKGEGHVYMDGRTCFNCGTAAPVVVGEDGAIREVIDSMRRHAMLSRENIAGSSNAMGIKEMILGQAELEENWAEILTAALAGE